MQNGFRFSVPIRIKILVMVLLIVTLVVSLITLIMTQRFQKDKTLYVFDLTSVMALHMAEEANTILQNYGRQLNAVAEAVFARDMSESQRTEFVQALLRNNEDFISVVVYEERNERLSVVDLGKLKRLGLSKEQYLKRRSFSESLLDEVQQTPAYLENSTFSAKLPSFILALSYTSPVQKRSAVIIADIQLTTLLRLGGKSRLFDTFLVDSKGILLSHPQVNLVLERKSFAQLPVVKEFLRGKTLAGTLEYTAPTDQNKEMIGAYAWVEFGKLAAIVEIPKSVAFSAAQGLTNFLMLVALVILVVSALISLFWSVSMSRPIEELTRATRVLSEGHFDIHIKRRTGDEIGVLADSFNRMAQELQKREKALRETQGQLIQSEKMAAFGQLGAGIAHEVKNPLAGILGYAQLILTQMDQKNPVRHQVEVIEKEAKRCKVIIEQLLKFARQEKPVLQPVRMNRIIEEAIKIVEHQLSLNRIRIDQELSHDLPLVQGSPNQLVQVLMNLLLNAQQAMEEGGVIKISSQSRGERSVEVRVSDTGPGISKELHRKIFEPFFTTKPLGKGTGLGLSVSYGIIQEHHGEIRVESEDGKGTTFVITLPVLKDHGSDVLQTPCAA